MLGQKVMLKFARYEIFAAPLFPRTFSWLYFSDYLLLHNYKWQFSRNLVEALRWNSTWKCSQNVTTRVWLSKIQFRMFKIYTSWHWNRPLSEHLSFHYEFVFNCHPLGRLYGHWFINNSGKMSTFNYFMSCVITLCCSQVVYRA